MRAYLLASACAVACAGASTTAVAQTTATRTQGEAAVVEEVIEKFLECGDLSRGFARIRCQECCCDVLKPSKSELRSWGWREGEQPARYRAEHRSDAERHSRRRAASARGEARPALQTV